MTRGVLPKGSYTIATKTNAQFIGRALDEDDLSLTPKPILLLPDQTQNTRDVRVFS
jgi:hypothetical protein